MPINMKIVELDVRKLKKPIEEVSKELEVINLALLEIPESLLKKDFQTWIVKENVYKENEDDRIHINDEYMKNIKKPREKTQFQSFQKAMKLLFTFGMILGFNPVIGLLQNDVAKIRFSIFSFKFLHAMTSIIIQTIALGVSLYRQFTMPISIGNVAYAVFYFSTWTSAIMFVQIASKWPIFVKKVFNCNMDAYVDPDIIKNIRRTCIVLPSLAVLEHALSQFARIIMMMDCKILKRSLFEETIRYLFSWIYDLGLPYNFISGITLNIVSWSISLSWNYTDIFIVCMSQFLTSILNQINKKVIWVADKSCLSPSIWTTLREDYTRATRLVRLFDDMFSGLILMSFASNLFFICLQLFNIFAQELNSNKMEKCPNFPSGPLNGYENAAYLTFSLFFLFIRFLTVSIMAARVNAASVVTSRALYRVPSCAYSKEVQRFLEQLHGGEVALSGLKFFYVTRELVLSVAATIVTYELVLLQFHKDELDDI